MKLRVDLSLLEEAVKQMGAEPIKFENKVKFDSKIDEILNSTSGKEINIHNIKIVPNSNGLFEYNGNQVVLFIPNQYYTIDDILKDPSKGNKFHLCDCSTLQKMKYKNKYNKYAVTYNTSGKFQIYHYQNPSYKVNAKLFVCKNCLSQLNYKNYKYSSYYEKENIVKNFNLKEFFNEYSSYFEELPQNQIYSIDIDEDIPF